MGVTRFYQGRVPEAIEYAHEFITKKMGLKIDYISIFGGEGDVPICPKCRKLISGQRYSRHL